MKNIINLIFICIIAIVFNACATWDGVKKDTSSAYKNTKKAIHEATE